MGISIIAPLTSTDIPKTNMGVEFSKAMADATAAQAGSEALTDEAASDVITQPSHIFGF